MRRLLIAAACAGLLVSALPAAAGDVIGRDRAGDVRAPRLTKAERAALDLVSVEAIGEEELGVVVIATFSGDVGKAFGRGHLRNALAAMILHPKSAAQAPAGLVTRGAGQGRVLRKTRATTVDAIRDGRTVTFIIAGSGYSNVARVQVKSLAEFALGSARTVAQEGSEISAADFKRLLRPGAADTVTILVDSKALNCNELARLRRVLQRKLRFVLHGSPREQFLQGLLAKVSQGLLQPPCTAAPDAAVTGTDFRWSRFSSKEVAGRGRLHGQAGTQVKAVRVSVPPSGATPRMITNHLCPVQLPSAQISGNTIVCSGGVLEIGQEFTLNLELSPVPNDGMGGDLSAQVDTVFLGPFPIGGP